MKGEEMALTTRQIKLRKWLIILVGSLVASGFMIAACFFIIVATNGRYWLNFIWTIICFFFLGLTFYLVDVVTFKYRLWLLVDSFKN